MVGIRTMEPGIELWVGDEGTRLGGFGSGCLQPKSGVGESAERQRGNPPFLRCATKTLRLKPEKKVGGIWREGR